MSFMFPNKRCRCRKKKNSKWNTCNLPFLWILNLNRWFGKQQIIQKDSSEIAFLTAKWDLCLLQPLGKLLKLLFGLDKKQIRDKKADLKQIIILTHVHSLLITLSLLPPPQKKPPQPNIYFYRYEGEKPTGSFALSQSRKTSDLLSTVTVTKPTNWQRRSLVYSFCKVEHRPFSPKCWNILLPLTIKVWTTENEALF